MRGQRHEPGVDFADREHLGCRVPVLDDSRDVPRGVAHDASVAVGLGQLGGHHADRVACGLDEAPQGFGAHEGHIAIENQDLGVRRKLGHRLLHGVPGTELLRLQHPLHLRTGKRRAHRLGAMAVNHHDAARREHARHGEHMGEQRPAGEGMQDFGQARAHALALARGEDEDFERHPVESMPILAF
jgi:hypothetical protein